MNRRQVPLVEFDTLDDVHRLWFYGVFFTDIKMVQAAAGHAFVVSRQGDDGRDPHGVFQALSDAAIVRYGRCFLGCTLPSGTTRTKLPPRYVFEGPLGVCHRQVIAMRHGLVAHADLRERRMVLRKALPNEAQKWHLIAGGGAMLPDGIMLLSGLCEQLRKMVVEEVRPLIEKRIDAMDFGEELDLASLVEQPAPSNVTWIE